MNWRPSFGVPKQYCGCWILFLRAVPQKFENDLFTLKRHQLLSVRSTPDKFLNPTITSCFGVWEKARSGKSRETILIFQKAPFSKCFSSTWKREVGVFIFLLFEKLFWKVPFSWQISVDGRPNWHSYYGRDSWIRRVNSAETILFVKGWSKNRGTQGENK